MLIYDSTVNDSDVHSQILDTFSLNANDNQANETRIRSVERLSITVAMNTHTRILKQKKYNSN